MNCITEKIDYDSSDPIAFWTIVSGFACADYVPVVNNVWVKESGILRNVIRGYFEFPHNSPAEKAFGKGLMEFQLKKPTVIQKTFCNYSIVKFDSTKRIYFDDNNTSFLIIKEFNFRGNKVYKTSSNVLIVVSENNKKEYGFYA